MLYTHPVLIALYNDAKKFMENSHAWLQQIGLPAESYVMDHLCYRVETQERCLELRLLLETYGKEISEAQIGGRPIYVWKLTTPFTAIPTPEELAVSVLELPAPKAGSFYAEGFEHAEYVVPETLKALEMRCAALGIRVNTDGMQKKHNPEIRIYHPDGWSVKFHENSLEECILHESKVSV